MVVNFIIQAPAVQGKREPVSQQQPNSVSGFIAPYKVRLFWHVAKLKANILLAHLLFKF